LPEGVQAKLLAINVADERDIEETVHVLPEKAMELSKL